MDGSTLCADGPRESRCLDSVIGLQISYNYSSPAQLGDKKVAFEEDLRRPLRATDEMGFAG
ncbi:hypothetical protein AVL59_21065 [Streptomyces griseochromogenes]|uniref:Uncharacterized protein n=1 Tax=Streptomyces griseochromogenes TaxID=68214 RepID=A0A1B1AYU3_9ACTN|nr:hypothetical protein AVL59_21065 [Streptomyces griseochromogenes]